MKHQGTKRLETDRLILRQFKMEDAAAVYHNWANDPEVTKFLTWPTHKTVEVTQHVLTDWADQYQKDDYYHWAITFKENGDQPIGSMAVVHKDDAIEMVHMGYCIGQKWWGKGIAAEALTALIQFFFEEVGVNRIEARHDPLNTASGKVMEKCGLTYEGIHREADRNNQGRCDIVMRAILAKDYFRT